MFSRIRSFCLGYKKKWKIQKFGVHFYQYQTFMKKKIQFHFCCLLILEVLGLFKSLLELVMGLFDAIYRYQNKNYFCSFDLDCDCTCAFFYKNKLI